MNSDFLALTAQLAVGIAGFSGVIVALESREVRNWDPLRRRSLRILLQLSGMVVLFSLLPLAIYRVADGPGFWTWALAVYGVAHVVDATSFVLRQPSGARVGPAWAGVAMGVGQLMVALWASAGVAEIVYLISLIGQLAGAAMGFVFLIWGGGAAARASTAS